MNNISFSDKFLSKTQEHTLSWVPVSSRNPGYSDKFIVTLSSGCVVIDKFELTQGWTVGSVIAWAKVPQGYTQPQSQKNKLVLQE